MKLLQYSIIILCLLWGAPAVKAQRVAPARWEFGIGAGIFIYQGDLTPAAIGGYKDPKLGLNLFAARIMSKNLALRGQLSLSTLKTDESKYDKPAWRQQRNLAFKAPMAEFSVLAVWHLKGDLQEDLYIKKLSPYVFAGAGLSVLAVRRDFSGFSSAYFENQPSVIIGLAADATRRPARVIPVVPVGAGVRYPLTEKISLMGEASYRLGSFNDYVDGVSLAGNPAKKDHYYSVSVGLVYRPFRNKGIGCPTY